MERFRRAITAWIGSSWSSGSHGISALATGRDGILSYEHIETIVRLAMRLDLSVMGEDFSSLLGMMAETRYREALSAMLRKAVKMWDDSEKARKRREANDRVAEYDAAEKRKKEWKADPANGDKTCSPEIADLPPKPVSEGFLGLRYETD